MFAQHLLIEQNQRFIESTKQFTFNYCHLILNSFNVDFDQNENKAMSQILLSSIVIWSNNQWFCNCWEFLFHLQLQFSMDPQWNDQLNGFQFWWKYTTQTDKGERENVKKPSVSQCND